MTCSTETAASLLLRDTRLRTLWNELPGTVRRAIESAMGSPRVVEPISAGLNCGIAAVLHTPTGGVFIKGLPHDHPRVATQRREAEINPYVARSRPACSTRSTSTDGTSWPSSTSRAGTPTSPPVPPTCPRSPTP